MERWISFFAEYNFSVEYKPRILNVVADSLSRRLYFEPGAHFNSAEKPTLATLTVIIPSSILLDDVRKAYEEDNDLLRLMDHLVNLTHKSFKDLPAL